MKQSRRDPAETPSRGQRVMSGCLPFESCFEFRIWPSCLVLIARAGRTMPAPPVGTLPTATSATATTPAARLDPPGQALAGAGRAGAVGRVARLRPMIPSQAAYTHTTARSPARTRLRRNCERATRYSARDFGWWRRSHPRRWHDLTCEKCHAGPAHHATVTCRRQGVPRGLCQLPPRPQRPTNRWSASATSTHPLPRQPAGPHGRRRARSSRQGYQLRQRTTPSRVLRRAATGRTASGR